MIERLCVIGVGLIGGSFALALKQAGLVREVVGVDVDASNLSNALHLGVIDTLSPTIEEGAGCADLIFVAVPVGASKNVFRHLVSGWRSDAVYTDAGSTKGSVLNALQAVFGSIPPNFVPGHPIAGAETSGAGAARVGLFEHRKVILTPVAETDPAAIARMEAIWTKLGAKVIQMSAGHHDEVLAATSHLPHVLAFVLTDLLGRSDQGRELFSYGAGGLRDFTRIASSDPSMWRDITLANRDHLVPLIESYRDALGAAAALMRSGDSEGLTHLFTDARAHRQRFIDQLEN